MDGEELRRRRAALELTQEDLARRLDVTRQSVYAWERGITRPPGMLDLALRYLELEADGRILATAPEDGEQE